VQQKIFWKSVAFVTFLSKCSRPSQDVPAEGSFLPFLTLF
jgi:hypothetical protein